MEPHSYTASTCSLLRASPCLIAVNTLNTVERHILVRVYFMNTPGNKLQYMADDRSFQLSYWSLFTERWLRRFPVFARIHNTLHRVICIWRHLHDMFEQCILHMSSLSLGPCLVKRCNHPVSGV